MPTHRRLGIRHTAGRIRLTKAATLPTAHRFPHSACESAMKAQRLTDQFQKIIDLAGRLAGLVAADALLVLLEGATDWDQLKMLVGDGKVLIAADVPEQLEGAADAGLATVVLNMAD